jgi:hypothetical protein
MTKTMTVEQLMQELAAYPPNLPVFFYDFDKERDSCLQKLELNGLRMDPDDGGMLTYHTPYYCKGRSAVEEYWAENGFCPILCLRELHPEENNDN